MLTLTNGMLLYHGSFIQVSEIDLSKCKQYAKFDIIGGKIADDQTARTLQLYTTRAYGEPGSEDADSFAIKMLLPNRLEDQFCFCNEKAIQSLEFIRSDNYDFKHL